MPTSLSSALGRINKYGASDGGKEREEEEERKTGTEKAIFIRDTFHEQNGRAHVRAWYRRDYGPDLLRAYKFQTISASWKNYNFAVGPKLPDWIAKFFITCRYTRVIVIDSWIFSRRCRRSREINRARESYPALNIGLALHSFPRSIINYWTKAKDFRGN